MQSVPSMMGINCRIFLPFLLFYCFKGSSAQKVNNVVTYTTKSVEELECRFTSSVVQWTEQLNGGGAISLFFYDVSNASAIKQTKDSKYDNFNYSIKETNQFNLLIANVDKDDGGIYQCSPIPATPVTFGVTVEVLPELITINCTDLHVCMPSAAREADQPAPQTVCICMATGVGSEMVEIEWKGASSHSTRNTTRDMDPTTGTFNISSKTTFPPSEETSSVSCSLTGYKSQIPKRLRSFTYPFSPPECTLSMQQCSSDGTSASLICNCSDGSSELNAYTLYNSTMFAIGTHFSNESLIVQVEPNRNETFYCSGCNGVMHTQIVKHELKCLQQGSTWRMLIVIILIILGVLLVILVVAAIVYVFEKVLKGKKKKKTLTMDNRVGARGKDKPDERLLSSEDGDSQKIPSGGVKESREVNSRQEDGSDAKPLLNKKSAGQNPAALESSVDPDNYPKDKPTNTQARTPNDKTENNQEILKDKAAIFQTTHKDEARNIQGSSYPMDATGNNDVQRHSAPAPADECQPSMNELTC